MTGAIEAMGFGTLAAQDWRSVLAAYYRVRPERAGIAIERHGEPPERITRAALVRGAAGYADRLRALGVRVGDRVVLSLPTSADFLFAFWGVTLLDAVPVPAYPPIPGARFESGRARLRGILGRTRPAAFVTMPFIADLVADQDFVLPTTVCEAPPPEDPEPFFAEPAPSPDATALIQFTSGTTAAGQGCVLSHRAVLANAYAILSTYENVFAEESRQVVWLPLYHDMGLMTGVYVTALYGALGREEHTALIPPEDFLFHPLDWLTSIDRHRAQYSWAPNFALALVTRKLAQTSLELDLSCVRAIVTGAEPVDPAVVRGFTEALAPHGLPPDAVRPAWGLAENTVFGTLASRGLAVDRVRRASLEQERLAYPAGTGTGADDRVVEVTSVGRPWVGCEIRVVDEVGRVLPDRRVGEVLLRSPSLMDGYFEDEAATRDAFQDGWLRTGDLGYLVEGELFLVGRRKDLLIVAGRNLMPQDLEAVASQVPGVRAGNVVAFGMPSRFGTEVVAVVAEVRDAAAAGEIVAEVRRRLAAELDVVAQLVLLVSPGVIAKTSSGKLQRAELRERYLRGTLAVLHTSTSHGLGGAAASGRPRSAPDPSSHLFS